ncbi:MAG: hypothetical protein WA946_04070 [Nitrospirota bacterium]
MTWLNNNRGVSLIAAVFIIVVLAFMGVMFVSLINTSSFTLVNDMQATQALYVAEGGVEYEQRNLAQNFNWYRSVTDPLYNDPPKNLGGGSFTATVRVPATLLRKGLSDTALTATVYSTSGFPANGYLQIDDDVTGGAEFVQYTIFDATTVTLIAPRGRTIGTVVTAANDFVRGTAVYPVMTLSLAGGLTSTCLSPASFTLVAASTPIKLLSSGTIDIEGEEINYSGSTVTGTNMTLTGVQRCMNGTGPMAHANGQPVTPVLIGDNTADYQAEITSTGTVGAAVRTVKKTVQRSL